MERKDIDKKYKWNLEAIYPTLDDFEKDYKLIETEISDLDKYEDIFLKNGKSLYNFLKKDEEIGQIIEKLYAYTNLNYDVETKNNKAQELRGRVKNLYEEYQIKTSFVRPKLLTLDYSKIDEFIKEYKNLSKYEIMLRRIYRYKEHTLEQNEEKLLSDLNKVFDRSAETYEILTDTDIELGNIKDENGNTIKLTDSNYSIYIESKDRNVRIDAFNTLYEGYGRFKNTITSTMSGNINELYAISKIRKYKSIIDMLVFSDEVTREVYDNLVKTVDSNLDTIYKFFKMKKEILGLEELHLYDTYVPLINIESKKYTYEEAQDIVLNALNILGEDYTSILKQGFEDGWVDVYPNDSKRSGAYSGGSYLTYPYILLNFEGKYGDVSTLAHEIGHSMHSFYTRENNDYTYGDYTIFVAEVASTVNELLLAHYMLNISEEKEEKLYILDRLMSLYKATIYRQTMFAEFEEKAFTLVEKNKVLTADLLSEEYYKLNKKYFGDNVVVDDNIRYEWLRIPHFYYNFYVYKYATGLSAATYIANRIIKGEDNAVADYKKFLKSGSKLSPIESLKLAGVDLTDPKVVKDAINYFDNIINEFKTLIKDTNN